MDEIVLKAMARWPDVPAVYGWLALDRRGQWQLKGDRIENPAITAFIARNYTVDREGCWFFQNGPQRVFVDLEYTPWVVRLAAPGALVTHTGLTVASVGGVWVDDDGVLVVATEHGPALIDDRDVEDLSAAITDRAGGPLDEDALITALERLQQGAAGDLLLRYGNELIPLQPIRAADIPTRFAFNPHPAPRPGAPACK
jgi:hypothetical protein